MNRIKVSEHFHLDEFIPKEIHDQFGAKGLWFIDREMIEIAQFLRLHYDVPVTINNYAFAKSGETIYNNSGTRHPASTVGSSLSQHKFKSAIDCKFRGITPAQIRADVMSNEEFFYWAGIRCIEDDTPTWVHFDKRNTDYDGKGTPKILVVPFQ